MSDWWASQMGITDDPRFSPPLPESYRNREQAERRISRTVNDLRRGRGFLPRYERVPIRLIVPSAGGPSLDQVNGGGFGYGFDSSTRQTLHFMAALPSSYYEGSDLVPVARWLNPSTATAGAAVVWELSYQWPNTGEAVASASAVALTSTAQAAPFTLVPATWADISGTGHDITSVLIGSLARETTATGDSLGSKAILLDFALYAPRDGFGAESAEVKWRDLDGF